MRIGAVIAAAGTPGGFRAYEKLEKLSDNGGAEDPEKPDDSKPDDSKPDDSKPDTSKPETPTTGDNSTIVFWMGGAMLLAASAIVLLSKKQRYPV